MKDFALYKEDVESLFDYLDDTQFWIKDKHGYYLKVNRAFQINYSLASVEDAVGLDDFDISPPWLAEDFRADDQRVLQGKRVINRIELVGGFDMSTRWFRTSKLPVHDEQGEIVATTGVTQLLPGLLAADFPIPGLRSALSAMQQKPSLAWTNGELARHSGLSVSAFERSFRRHLQISPMQFLKRLRLSQAAAALVRTEQQIAEIAEECGFCDQSHLSREFKRFFGAAPLKWRSQHLVEE
ncbi:MAG: helix-turn-helix domain-containing protein [Verrucomicrobiota bacterium]